MIRSLVIPISLWIGAGSVTLVEAEPPTVQTHEKRSEDGVEAAIHFRNLQSWHSRQTDARQARQARRTEWMEALGLDLAFTYDSLAMGAVAADDAWGGASGDATLNLRWQIIDDDHSAPLSLNARARHRHAYSEFAPSTLKSSTGAFWGYVDGFTDAGFQVPEFFFEDRLFDRRLTLRYGQMSIDDLLDGHELRSAKRSFMNQAFSSSPAVGFPSSDLGFVGRWQSLNHWDFTLAVSNVAGSNLRETTDWKLDSGALFEAVQLGHDFTGLADRASRVQLLVWRSDALPEEDLDSGRGVSLTYEQSLSQSSRLFLKYAWADGRAATTLHFASAGYARDFSVVDRAGIALATGQSSSVHKNWQGILEVFYRRQIGSSWMITPDLQLAAGDHLGGDRNWVVIAGLRVGVAF